MSDETSSLLDSLLGESDSAFQHEVKAAPVVEPPPLDPPVTLSPAKPPTVVVPVIGTPTETEPVDEILQALLKRITPVEEATPYRKMLWYGPPGTWKTVTACTAPRPMLVAIEKNGPLSLRNHPELLAKTLVFEFKSFVQLETLITKMTEKPDAFPCDTVIIDTINELQKYDLDVFIAKAHREDSARSEYKATWDEYGASTEHMRRFVTSLERLPKNVILLCHTRQTEDKTRGILLEGPDLTAKLAGTIHGKMDLTGYMTVVEEGGVKYGQMQVHPTARITAKTRMKLPSVVTSPTWDLLLDYEAQLNKK